MNVNTSISRPVLRYHGGKFLLAPWIVSNIPAHRVYVDLFGGGGSVLMRKERSFSEVYNDKWGVVVNVFRVLQDRELCKELYRSLYNTPFSREEFNLACSIHEDKIECPVEKARITIIRSFMGFGSASANRNHSTGFRANSNRSGTAPVHDWMNYVRHIYQFRDRLRGVVIENRDYSEIIKQQDSATTFFYADPPYVHETRKMASKKLYELEMTNEDHELLIERLKDVKGKVMISGYRCKMYDDLLSSWWSQDINTHADGANDRVETIWTNYDPAVEIYRQPKLFEE